ncbi:hypothetical protein F4810DRAFT_650346 [Camillea tinctor]|nr:hypothetical protein F4810DRAFT_650346 [Camillea tinctor]
MRFPWVRVLVPSRLSFSLAPLYPFLHLGYFILENFIVYFQNSKRLHKFHLFPVLTHPEGCESLHNAPLLFPSSSLLWFMLFNVRLLLLFLCLRFSLSIHNLPT